MMNTLTNLRVGEKAIIRGLKAGDCQNALLALGFLTGKSVEVTLRAPFKGPIAVRLGQTLISLRLEEALQVLIDTPNR
ncbi:MAG: FeoA family protein [Bacteroidota bacterium]